MAVALSSALSYLGTTPFTIEGVSGNFSGHLGGLQTSRGVSSRKPGISAEYDARMLVPVTQFANVQKPIDETLANKLLTAGGRTYRISLVEADPVSVTLTLKNPTSNRS